MMSSPHPSDGRLKIERIETFLVDLPTIRPHKLSVATMEGQTLMIVRLYASDGVVGVGEAATIAGLAYGPESPEGMKLAIDTYVAPVLMGCDPRRVQATMRAISAVVKGNHFAKCAVETALLDAQGKRFGLSVSELCGGRVRDALPVAWTLASGDTKRDIDEAEAMLARRRHRVFKLKIGRQSVEADVAHVAEIKKALGDRASIRVDVNMAWNETDAVRGLSGLRDAGCDMVEQPVAQIAALARLTARGILPIMADEVLQGPASAFDLAQRHAADIFAVKLLQSGGLMAAGQVGAIADAAGIGLYGGTMLEGAVSTVASAHVFASFPHLDWGTELFGPLLITEEILEEPLRYADFELAIPTGPGLGVALDEDRLNHFRRDGARRLSVVAGSAAAKGA
ncbi:muconate/chloromuconate family cycloisomerase [Brevundimonas sanguinis]|uniref:muconate/chloromuconate family cycloisomerase n=1 Tax=Brevundimonas sanguinis TaxID=3021811 RepID=UPI002414FF7E|nr:muconate/chloromuconate family cycloisomerase [Brevundimonas sp. NCCP 15609]